MAAWFTEDDKQVSVVTVSVDHSGRSIELSAQEPDESDFF